MSTPSEQLRTAAETLRTMATEATPGPWKLVISDSGLSYRELNASVVTDEHADLICDADYDGSAEGPHADEGSDAAFIALMDPNMALMLADWLDSEADQAEHFAHIAEWDQPKPQTAALALAEHINGRTSNG